jgi:ankyrin repeat protein
MRLARSSAAGIPLLLAVVSVLASAPPPPEQEDYAGNRGLYEACGPAVVQIIRGGRPAGAHTPTFLIEAGHGFFVTDQGHVVTTYHQVGTAGRLIVEDAEGRQATAKVLHGDPVRDVALLKIDEATPHHLSITPEDPPGLSGMEVFLIRYKDETPERVLSGRVIDTETGLFGRVINSTVPGRSGDSGSPLVDDEGRLLGLNRGGFDWGKERPRTHTIHLSTLREILEAYRAATGFELTIIQDDLVLPVLLRLWDAPEPEEGTEPPPNGVTTLMRAAAHGRPDVVDRLLRKGAQVDAQDAFGNTALAYALAHKHEEPVRPLLSHGADPNATDSEGLTPLMVAVSMRLPLAIAALIEARADVNAVHADTGYSVLQGAVIYADEQTICTLIEAGAEVNYSGPRGTTALMGAASRSRAGVIEALIDAGANIHAKDDMTYTALHFALFYAGEETVQTLLRLGADANLPAIDGITPLMMAARTGNPDMIRLLIDAGAELEAGTSSGGYTALMYAASYGTPANVAAFLDAGADVTATTDEGYTALDMAKHRRDQAASLIVELLAACESDISEQLIP